MRCRCLPSLMLWSLAGAVAAPVVTACKQKRKFSGPCAEPAECVSEACRAGECVPPCIRNEDCAPAICVQGKCTTASTSAQSPATSPCPASLDCGDGNACTADACDPATGCRHDNLSGTACSDGSACSPTDTCTAGICAGAILCDDGKSCTADSCAGLACQFASTCDDGNPCTQDVCVAGSLCEPTPMPDGAPCLGTTCTGGLCGGKFGAGSFALGVTSACAVRSDGTVWCWGTANSWQFSGPPPGSSTTSPLPVATQSGTDVVSVAANYDSVCIARKNATTACWGFGAGSEGLCGGVSTSGTPVECPSAGGAARVFGTTTGASIGNSAMCALTQDGDVKCWRETPFWWVEPGKTPFVKATNPLFVAELAGVTHLSFAAGLLCAVEGGAAVCMGTDRTTGAHWQQPTKVPGLPAVRRVAVGPDSACAVATSGRAWCWGDNAKGQLGRGQAGGKLGAGMVPGLTNVMDVDIGQVACAIRSDGAVWCWGSAGEETYGLLGPDHTAGSVAPVPIPGLPEPVVGVQVERSTACARAASGKMWCWGRGDSGQIGSGTFSKAVLNPQPVATIP